MLLHWSHAAISHFLDATFFFGLSGRMYPLQLQAPLDNSIELAHKNISYIPLIVITAF
jgi:hypothetical protein